MHTHLPSLVLALCGLILSCGHDNGTPQGPAQGPQQDAAVQENAAAPTWPEGALLTVVDKTGDSLTISWPAAIDDQAVLTYQITVDGLDYRDVSGSQSSVLITPLHSATEYTIQVVAKDAEENRSNALELVVATADVTAPSWSPSVSLSVFNITETSAELAWSPATDDTGVHAYEIWHQDSRLATVPNDTMFTLLGLTAWTEYDLYLVALDQAGNRSLSGPMNHFKTTDETAPSWDEGAALFTNQVTASSVTLTWPDAIDNVAITKYELLKDGVVTHTTNAFTTSATVAGLPPGAEVSFSIRATDEAGNVSTTGPSVIVNTEDDNPPTWPIGASLLVSNLMPNSLVLAWTEAADDVGVALYRIYQDGVEVAQVSNHNVEIFGLNPWTNYSFTVTAQDGASNMATDNLSVRVQTPDNNPPSWAEGDAITVSDLTPVGFTMSWPLATDDASVQGYTVYQDDVRIAELGAQSTSLQVSGLSPWTTYSLRVQVVDPAGNVASPGLTLDVQTPDESTPSWPDGALTATQITPTSVTVAWTAAQDDVAITQYRLFVDGTAYALVDGQTTSLEVVGLSPWTDYALRVEAKDAAENWSQNGPSLSVKTTDEVAPSWPADAALSVITLESNSLTLSWPEAIDDVGIHRYVISLDDVDHSSVQGSANSATIGPLAPVTTYLVSVFAEDPAGNPTPTLSLTITTPDGGPPTWPQAILSATEVTNDTVTLNWTEAVDDVGVTGYRLYQNGALLSEGSQQQFVVENLTQSTQYEFKVEAGDAAGNWSTTGPSAQVTTTEVYDPGFRRLTTEQFQRALSDVSSTLWREGCENFKTARGWEGEGCPTHFEAYQQSSHVYYKLTEKHYGNFLQYRDTFPKDARKGAPKDVYGGHWRLDQSVFSEHVTSWTLAVMTLATDWFGEKEHGSQMRGFRLVAETCLQNNNAGVTNFGTDEELYQNCAYDFIQRLGRRAFRRPLTEQETAFFNSIYDDTDENYPELELGYLGRPLSGTGLRNVMAAILLSPEFLYHIEVGDGNGNLTPYELASRLSFHFWNTTPDDELLAAAEDGSIMTEQGYQAQVNRLFNDPRGQRAVKEFYSAYFRVDDINDIDAQDGPYRSELYHSGPNYEEGTHPDDAVVAGGYNKQNNTRPMYLRAAKAELLNLGEWFTRTHPGTYEDMFRSNLHFLECQQGSLAGQCYGAAAYSLFSYRILGTCLDMQDCADQAFIDTENGWDGVSDPITLPEPERAGLITRISFLGDDTLNARPIQRGLKIRDMLLCEPIPPPEDCDVVKPPNLTGHCELDGVTTGQSCSHDIQCGQDEVCVNWDKEVTMTIREKVEELTETPGTSCAGCHSTFINGFGHALNHFSSAGQYWEKEHMFSDTRHPQTGGFLFETLTPEHWREIDASSTFFFDGAQVSVDGAHEAADLLVDSGKLERCWSREYFRFAMGRVEHESDLATIESFAQSLRDGVTLTETFKSVAHLPQFKTLTKIPIGQAEEEATP